MPSVCAVNWTGRDLNDHLISIQAFHPQRHLPQSPDVLSHAPCTASTPKTGGSLEKILCWCGQSWQVRLASWMVSRSLSLNFPGPDHRSRFFFGSTPKPHWGANPAKSRPLERLFELRLVVTGSVISECNGFTFEDTLVRVQSALNCKQHIIILFSSTRPRDPEI